MGMPSLNTILFNVAGGAVVVAVIGYMGFDFVTTPKVPRCTERYPAGQQFAFESMKGQPLSPIELQARAGLREWGVLRNSKIIKNPNAPAGSVLEVSLASTENEDLANQNGVGFAWPLADMPSAASACLSYSVFLPKGFEFKEPGYLPGLYGAADVAQLDEEQPKDSFAVRMGWAQSGDLGAEIRSPATAGYWQGAGHKLEWPRGQWVAIEQEVALNTPGEFNGVLRIWIDGALTVDSSNLNLRSAPESTLTGVVSDIGYARTASDPGTVQVSPFIVQWQ